MAAGGGEYSIILMFWKSADDIHLALLKDPNEFTIHQFAFFVYIVACN